MVGQTPPAQGLRRAHTTLRGLRQDILRGGTPTTLRSDDPAPRSGTQPSPRDRSVRLNRSDCLGPRPRFKPAVLAGQAQRMRSLVRKSNVWPGLAFVDVACRAGEGRRRAVGRPRGIGGLSGEAGTGRDLSAAGGRVRAAGAAWLLVPWSRDPGLGLGRRGFLEGAAFGASSEGRRTCRAGRGAKFLGIPRNLQ